MEKERAQVTLNSIGDGVISTDIAGNVTYLNQIAEAMTGWTGVEAQGRALSASSLNVIDRNFGITAFSGSISNRRPETRLLQFDAGPQFDDEIRRDAKEFGRVGRIAVHPGKKPAQEWI